MSSGKCKRDCARFNSAVFGRGGGGSFDRVFDFPGGHTKFTIHRDPKTGIYLSIVNPNTNIAFADQVTTRKTEHARAWVWV